MDVRQLKAFVAVAEAGTFTAGALRVHVTQAAVSMQIKHLEREAGSPLFVRTPRRVVLTEAGERLLVRSRNILREHDAALAELGELAGSVRGRLRLGSASAMISSDMLPRVLKRLRRRFPEAELTIVSGTSESLARLILAGEVDLGVVSLPVEERGVETERLTEDELIAIASPRHPLAARRVVSAFELAGERLILGERGGNTRRLIDEFFAAAGLKPQVAMELSRQSAIRRMVEADMGVGVVPRKTAREELAAGRLVQWWIEGARINWELGLAHLTGSYESPVRAAFRQLCREHFGTDKLEAATKASAGASRGKVRKTSKASQKRGAKKKSWRASGKRRGAPS